MTIAGASSSALPTVVVPVFNAYAELAECLVSLERTAGAAEVLLLDDASTDRRVPALLERWCAAAPRRLWRRQERNRGFVATANLGAELARGDIVLLNSDTRTTPGWLEALARCLASDPRIASATPWTNNGEIVSLPDFCRANPPPAEPDRVAERLAELMRAKPVLAVYPELPTAVGFCMAVPRRALDAFGLFDEAAFARGYGEENDFSLRAAAAGWRNVLCPDAYVVHHGGRSFGPLGLRPDEASMRRLLRKHPGYAELVADWIEADPLAALRSAVLAACGDTLRPASSADLARSG
jgi:GT2 family glycosyltransferase